MVLNNALDKPNILALKPFLRIQFKNGLTGALLSHWQTLTTLLLKIRLDLDSHEQQIIAIVWVSQIIPIQTNTITQKYSVTSGRR